MKNILVLGAGIFQVPLIKKIKQLGYKAIVASIGGDYPGISFADIFVEVDTTDAENIFKVAKKYNVSGVVTTGTDVSIPTMAAVSQKMNLRGPSLKAAEIVSSKTGFRQFLQEKKLNSPRFQKCMTISEAMDLHRSYTGKIVLKPDDASGSRGVSILPVQRSEEDVENCFRRAMAFSRNGLVCAEAFIPGKEVGGDAFLLNGEFIFFTTTHKHMTGTLVKGHTVPGSLSKNARKNVKEELSKVAQELGYLNGPLNFDVIVGKSKVTILEMGLRNGGNGIVNIVKQSEGIDLAEILVNYVLGNEIEVQKSEVIRKTSSYVFGARRSGILKHITPVEDLKMAVPEIIDMVLTKKPGDHVEAFSNNANLVGYFILDCSADQYTVVSQRIEDNLRLEVEEKYNHEKINEGQPPLPPVS